MKLKTLINYLNKRNVFIQFLLFLILISNSALQPSTEESGDISNKNENIYADNSNNKKENNTLNCEDDEIKCPTGVCMKNKYDCPNLLYCPEDYIPCNQFTCSKNEGESACQDKVCPINKIKCWDNSCVDKKENCPTAISCLDESNYKCWDNSCVTNKEECPPYRQCPFFLPIRCPNGDCRSNISDCPQLTKCGENLPVQCNDGSCKINRLDCNKSIKLTKCIDMSLTRCSDGSCTSAKFLCPTVKTCPTDMVKCNFGICAYKLEDCFDNSIYKEVIQCTDKDKVRCEVDNSCVSNITDCPTAIICPISKPVKCWDGSCRESISNCVAFSSCPKNMIECPDGSCATNKCGTQITCSREAPYKCYDNTCRKHPDDCPLMKQCTADKPFFCWDGNCYRKREECGQADKCDNNAPIKCPDNQCRTSSEECKAITECPFGFFKQLDGSCSRINNENSQSQEQKTVIINKICPSHVPIRCINGLCMRSSIFCPIATTEDFFNEGFLCADGSIVHHPKDCNIVSICEGKMIKCQDNSCVNTINECEGKLNNCPSFVPYRCDNGACVKNKDDCLNLSGCPVNNQLRCPDSGLCVDHTSKCKEEIKKLDLANGCSRELPIKCLTGYIGKCVNDIAECEFKKCKDGEIFFDGKCVTNPREYFKLCPTDPNKWLCSNGKCVEYIEDCGKPVCPEGEVQCMNETCKNNLEECPTAEGCTMDNPFRCTNGECKKYPTLYSLKGIDSNSCDISIQCPFYTPYLCANGSCVEKSLFCSPLEKCDDNKVRDFDRKCVSDKSSVKRCPSLTPLLCTNSGNCVKSIYECKDTFCPDNKPIKCVNGECTDNPQYCFINSVTCKDNEFICYDGSCRKNENDCPIYSGCLDLNYPFKCKDGSCKKSERYCNNYNNNIIDNNADNNNSKNSESSDETISSSEDESNNTSNVQEDQSSRYVRNRRILEETINSQVSSQESQNINESLTDTSDKNLNDNKQDNNNNKNTESNVELSSSEIQSESSSQSLENSSENKQDNITEKTYEVITKETKGFSKEFIDKCIGKFLCEDGICRTKCPKYNGCSNNYPMLCSNGMCVKSIYDCAGISNCYGDKPFKCSNGECKSNINECITVIKLSNNSSPLILFTSPGSTSNTDILLSYNNNILGNLIVPANAFSINKDDEKDKENKDVNIIKHVDATLHITTIPVSEIQNSVTYYDETRIEDVSVAYPFGDKKNKFNLEYEYSVLSSVVNIEILEGVENIKINEPLILTLAYNYEVVKRQNLLEENNEYSNNDNSNNNDNNNINNSIYNKNFILDPLKDVCLGKYNKDNNSFKCIEGVILTEKYHYYKLQSQIKETGAYGVIIYPRPDNSLLKFEPNFIVKNFILILIIFSSLFVLLSIGFYVFLRLYRYRFKYIDKKIETKKLQNKVKEMQNLGSSHAGQTVGDTIDQIIFTDNPAYKVQKVAIKSQRIVELEEYCQKYVKRLNLLEHNNKIIEDKISEIKIEISRLKSYNNVTNNVKEDIDDESNDQKIDLITNDKNQY